MKMRDLFCFLDSKIGYPLTDVYTEFMSRGGTKVQYILWKKGGDYKKARKHVSFWLKKNKESREKAIKNGCKPIIFI